MKKLLVFLCLLCSLSLFAQKRSDLGYQAGQNFVGADFAFLTYDDFSGGLVGVNFGRSLSERMAFGLATDFGVGNYDESVSFLMGSPFFRYNILIDGPVALFLQANLTIAAAFYDSESYGVVWPNLSGGFSYRLSDHFTAFAKMGMLSHMAFAFGSGLSDGGSSDGSWDDDYWDDEFPFDGDGFPFFVGFTKHPVIGIYYTF